MIRQARIWWDSIGDNFLMRLITQGELVNKYFGQMRTVSSLTEEEILLIYKKENL